MGLERPEAILVLDDGYAREFARQRGLKFLGVVALVLRAKREGRIQAAAPILDQLTATGFRLSSRVVAHARRLARE